MTRKLTALLCAALAALLLVLPAGAEELAGEWFLLEVEMGGETFQAAELGLSMSMTIAEDGTAFVFTANGDATETELAAWTAAEGGMTLEYADGDMQTFAVESGTAVLDLGEEGTMIFCRVDPASEDISLPNAVAAESEADFAGSWDLWYAATDGEILFPDELGRMVYLEIAPGAVTEVVLSNGEVEAAEFTPAFADGALVLTAVSGEDVTVTLRLNDDGTLSTEYTLDGEHWITEYYQTAGETNG